MPNATHKPWHTLEEEASLPASRADLNRARQFMPFASLKGFFSIVRDREKLVTPRRELQEDAGFIKGARIFAVGRNLLTVTNYTGADPEVDSNLQLGKYPNTKQFTIGAELTF